jgi:hypothetical protein
MTRFTKTESGKYSVHGNTYEMLVGTRAQVWHGTAFKTNGGLSKKDLVQNKAGRIVSKAKHSTAKKEMRLVKAGYGTKKGKFGYVKLSGKSRKMKGGMYNVAKAGVVSNNVNGNNNGNNNVQHPVAAVGAVRRGGSKRRGRGGMVNLPLSPSYYDGKGEGTSGVELQFIAGQGGSKRRGRGRRGGMANLPLSPSYYDGKGVGTSGVELQFIAGQGN